MIHVIEVVVSHKYWTLNGHWDIVIIQSSLRGCGLFSPYDTHFHKSAVRRNEVGWFYFLL